jgi:hypothetical protein
MQLTGVDEMLRYRWQNSTQGTPRVTADRIDESLGYS